jgi:pSer/pThr/pTyr-binding forkhead associated (FHA) protein
LARQRVYLGRRKDSDGAAPLNSETALCQLQFLDGWWYVAESGPPSGLLESGTVRNITRLEPSAELVVGRARFRVVYQSPQEAQAALEAVAEDVLFEGANAEPDERPKEGPAAVPPGTGVAARPTVNNLLGRLVPLGGGMDYPLMKPRLTVGRKSSCDVVIRSSTVSAMHCGLELVDGYWRVLDLGARNGIRVNGVRCQRGWLFPNSRLSIANHRFQISYTPQGPPPEPDVNDPSYRIPLMQKIGATEKAWEQTIARHEVAEKEKPKPVRYDLTEDL